MFYFPVSSFKDILPSDTFPSQSSFRFSLSQRLLHEAFRGLSTSHPTMHCMPHSLGLSTHLPPASKSRVRGRGEGVGLFTCMQFPQWPEEGIRSRDWSNMVVSCRVGAGDGIAKGTFGRAAGALSHKAIPSAPNLKLFVCMYIVRLYVCTCLCMRVSWRPTPAVFLDSTLPHFLFYLVFETRFLTVPGTHCSARLCGRRALGILQLLFAQT